MKTLMEYGIGDTPLQVEEMCGNKVGFKLEQFNRLGSIKDRIAYYMIDGINEKRNTSKEQIKVCESTSGNLGLALHYFCNLKGYQFLCLTDETIPYLKLEKLKSNGVSYEIVEQVDGLDFRDSRIRRAKELECQGYYWTNQYDSVMAIKAHYETTGPEIWQQTNGKITHLICSVGTGGTIIGTGKYLKEKNSHIKLIGVEPYGSTILGSEEYKYLSVGAGMKGKPGNILRHMDLIDAWEIVKDEDSIRECRKLHENYNLNVGITSGMAYHAARKIIDSSQNQYIVIICPDGSACYEQYF